MGRKRDENASDNSSAEERVGGFAFFLSLAVLTPTAIAFFSLTLSRIGRAEFSPSVSFALASLVGAAIAHRWIVRHISVLIHEFKHSLISNLVGNRHKGMSIEENSGHYQYAYTKKTAHYNSFISLAPYIVPLFSFFGLVFGALFCRHDRTLAAILVGLGYGADMVTNSRDVSPIQTDISLIRGGYWIGIAYILAWNVLTTAITLNWALYGSDGLLLLIEDCSAFFLRLYIALFGDPRL